MNPLLFRSLPPSVLLVLGVSGCISAPIDSSTFMSELAAGAIPLQGGSGHHRTVSHASPEAQKWFDQGLRYLYAFNQNASAACFARAALASPECPMAWWGVAQALSVDINDMDVPQDEARRALSAIHQAKKYAHHATPLERLLIQALATRTVVPAPPKTERKDIDLAYAEAMQQVWAKAPGDADIGVLFVESLMLLQPWNYWTSDREPIERANEIVTTLEKIIRMNQNHPGANHLYIHMVESSKNPERGIPSADRLGKLEPGSGHLVHMPSHIYVNVGRYKDAVTVNERAASLDEAYFKVYKKPTNYRFYFLHNLHFVSFASMMEGRKALALQYIKRMEQEMPEALLRMAASQVDGQLASKMHVYVRFGMWKEILAAPEYPAYRKASRAIRLYARTVALANQGQTAKARAELALFDKAAADTPEDWSMLFNPSQTMYGLARQIAEAEILWREGKPKPAIAILKAAIKVEKELVYTEPPAWMMPVRHTLGAIQLASGNALDAAETFRQDLSKHKENGWSLLGLHQSLIKLGKHTEAAAVKTRFDRAWARADISPPSSCYCAAAIK
jgi:tetratricopeptide (TPR) repeat protein